MSMVKSNWLVDIGPFNLDCKDSSCSYTTNHGGMRTNGGCRCSTNNGRTVERFLKRNYVAAQYRIAELEAKIAELEHQDQSDAEYEAGEDL